MVHLGEPTLISYEIDMLILSTLLPNNRRKLRRSAEQNNLDRWPRGGAALTSAESRSEKNGPDPEGRLFRKRAEYR